MNEINVEVEAESLPVSSSGRFYKKAHHKVAMIADEFLYHSFKDVADVVMLHPDTWYEQIKNSDFLFVVSAWRGLDDVWRGFANKGSNIRALALDIIEYCNDAGITTVFYSKEDPPNYDIFIEIAPYCKYVFTSAEEVIPKYERDCKHKRVYPLMFCINPLFHNPVGSQSAEKLTDVIFSGSWMRKYPERGKDLSVLFDGVLSSGRSLRILDRNFALNHTNYFFPDEYMPYVSAGVSHDILQKVHKLHDWAININSVKHSYTMFANRVFELQAAGNLLISNYSVGVNSHAPLVYIAEDSEEVKRILECLTPLEIQERQAAGLRSVMTGFTCYDRYSEICERIGLTAIPQQRFAAVVVKKITDTIREQFENQTYTDKRLILESELSDVYSDFDIITFFNDEMEYDVFYLEDMINGFKYTDRDYITKASYYKGEVLINGVQHDFVEYLPTKFCTVFWAESFDAQTLLDMPEGQIELANGYSIDCLNYNASKSIRTKQEREYKLSVIIPVCNNGLHLYGKAFSSLRRSSIFENLEIIFVDEGSTDGITKKYLKYLEKRYDNIKITYSCDESVEMALSEYIAFLKPENEAVNDGYFHLLNVAKEGGYDLIISNVPSCGPVELLEGYENKREFLKNISFESIKVMSMIIKKAIIKKDFIAQMTGAIFDDSFFSWQFIFDAKNIEILDFTVYKDYTNIPPSCKEFFKKSLTLERMRFEWLQNTKLLHDYMSTRFNNYFRDWYLLGFSECETNELVESANIVDDIFNIYSDYYNGDDKTINDFISYI